MRAIYIDSFSGSLADLPKKHWRDPEKVLEVLRRDGRFSVFDATANANIARTLDRLKDQGRIIYKPGIGYPWCEVTVVDAPGCLAAPEEPTK